MPVALTTTLFLAAVAPAQCDFTPVTNAIEQLLAANPRIPGVGMLIVKGDQVIYERYFRTYNRDTVAPIASGTKNPSAAVLMALVDRGLTDLDQPIGRYLAEYTDTKGTMTLGQLFSHTAGYTQSTGIISDNSITLREAARQIEATVPLTYRPGTAFAYGGVSMHVAGAACEVIGGKPFSTLFRELIGDPLRMSRTDYFAFGFTENPRIAGGMRSSMGDQANFYQFLKDQGFFEGRRLIGESAWTQMVTNRVRGLPILSSPEPDSGYGIGTWVKIETPDGKPVEVYGAGAFGFEAWAHLELDYYAIFFVADQRQRVVGTVDFIREYIRGEIARCTDTHPRRMTIPFGRLASGVFTDARQPDAKLVEIQPGPSLNAPDPVIVEVSGASALVSPVSITLNLDSSGSQSGLSQTVEAFDYAAQAWSPVFAGSVPLSNQARAIPLERPGRFVNPTDRTVRARVRVRSVALGSLWTFRLDRLNWTIR
jgi:CubicO group peptidase (beta-lactamase class C family)